MYKAAHSLKNQISLKYYFAFSLLQSSVELMAQREEQPSARVRDGLAGQDLQRQPEGRGHVWEGGWGVTDAQIE